MRFLLYNIRYGTGGRPGRTLGFLRNTEAHLQQIIRFIQKIAPDVMGLVEVDSGSYRSGRLNQAQVIGEALGHGHAYRSKYGSGSISHRIPILRRQGNAFLAKEPLMRGAKYHYFAKGMKRLVIELETTDFSIFLVHLALGGRVRHRQLTDLYNLLKGTQKPHIVAGDFNTVWGEHEIQLFRAATGLQSADRHNRPSFPSWAPRRHLDFILYSRGIRVRRFDMPSVTLSDHLPLVCDFDVIGAAAPTEAEIRLAQTSRLRLGQTTIIRTVKPPS